MPAPPGQPNAAPRVLVTAGPTHEPIDAVRYVANRSSGQLGIAIAQASRALGCPTTLLLGPIPGDLLADDAGVTLHRFTTTNQLDGLLKAHWPQHDVLVMAAAVADFIPEYVQAGKLDRQGGGLTLSFTPAPDLLKGLSATSRPDQILVGFALESPDNLLQRGRSKLEAKGLHAVVANPLKTMDAPNIDALLLYRDERVETAPPNMPKQDFAHWLMVRVMALAAASAG
jgi:phosphopantothenoylcysteine decarboxylase/phosphopantothenate--cysteine ligase